MNNFWSVAPISSDASRNAVASFWRFHRAARVSGLVWFAMPGKSAFDFGDRHPRLQEAVKVFEEGKEAIANEDFEKACEDFAYGIQVGRSVVLQLQEQEDSTDDKDAKLALDWLIASYLASGEARIQLEDWDMARKDLWAAGMYSQNTCLPALEALWTVCVAIDDDLGQFNTLTSLKAQLLQQEKGKEQPPEDKSGDRSDLTSNDGDDTDKPNAPMALEDVKAKLKELEAKLEDKYR